MVKSGLSGLITKEEDTPCRLTDRRYCSSALALGQSARGGEMTAHTINESKRDVPGITSLKRNAFALFGDLRVALRSVGRTPALWVTVALTLALGIGANAAIFSILRGVLLRPLVNRDEDRLIYIQQSARGIGADNAAFSVPEIQDLRARVKTLSAFGDFSTIGFTLVGLREHRGV